MPKVRFKPMVVEIQGKLYDVVFEKSTKGNMIISLVYELYGLMV